MKVRRLLEYDGPEEWVRKTLENSVTKDARTLAILGPDRTIREVYCEDQATCVVDLTRTDTYPDNVVPDHDVMIALKVLRTVGKAAGKRARYDVQLMASVAHDKLVELTKEVAEVELKEVSDAATVVHPGAHPG